MGQISEQHALNAARLTAARNHITAHESALKAMEHASLGREKKLLRAHEDTLERVFESMQKELDAKQVSGCVHKCVLERLSEQRQRFLVSSRACSLTRGLSGFNAFWHFRFPLPNARQDEVTEAEYQLATTKGKAAEYHDRIESMSYSRDSLEDLVLVLKLYALGGIQAVERGHADAHAALPRRLRDTLEDHEYDCLEEIHVHDS